MTAFNAVRFHVKPGQNQAFIAAHERVDRDWPGLRHVNMIQTGEQTFCIIGEWDSMEDLRRGAPAHDRDSRHLPRHARRRHRPCVGTGGAAAEVTPTTFRAL